MIQKIVNIILILVCISCLGCLVFIIVKVKPLEHPININTEDRIEQALIKINLPEYKVKIYPRIIAYSEQKYDVNWKDIVCMIMVESYFDEYAIGDSIPGRTKERARGEMQTLPSVMEISAGKLGFEYKKFITGHNPIKSIIVGTFLLSEGYRIWGKNDQEHAVKSYILGAANLQKYYKGDKRAKKLYVDAKIDESWERFQKFYNALEE